MAKPELTTLERAVQELGEGSTPDPTEWMDRYTPLACLWYVRQAAIKACQRWAEDLQIGADDELDEDGLLQRVTLGIGKAAAMLTECCVQMDMIAAPEGESVPEGLFDDDEQEVALG